MLHLRYENKLHIVDLSSVNGRFDQSSFSKYRIRHTGDRLVLSELTCIYRRSKINFHSLVFLATEGVAFTRSQL
jgi:hypothetical protein